MKIIATAVLTAGLLAASALVTHSAQAAKPAGVGPQTTDEEFILTANGTCSNDQVMIGGSSATACSGYYAGNDKTNDNALNLLNDAENPLFGGLTGWSLAATDGDFSKLFADGKTGAFGEDDTSGNWSLGKMFSGPATVAVKAGESFSLYYFESLSSFDSGFFSTAGVAPVGNKGNTPGLSHLSLYIADAPPEEPKTEVPEPFAVLGLAVVGGIGATLKRRPQ